MAKLGDEGIFKKIQIFVAQLSPEHLPYEICYSFLCVANRMFCNARNLGKTTETWEELCKQANERNPIPEVGFDRRDTN